MIHYGLQYQRLLRDSVDEMARARDTGRYPMKDPFKPVPALRKPTRWLYPQTPEDFARARARATKASARARKGTKTGPLRPRLNTSGTTRGGKSRSI